MIKGAEKTPYEDGLFFFDFQLSADYPKAPPVCFYHRWVVYFCENLNIKKTNVFFFKVSYLIVWTQTFTRMGKFVSAFLEPGVAKEPKPGPPIQICFSFLSPYKDLFWFRSLILMKLVTNDKKEHNKDWKIHECTMRWWS